MKKINVTISADREKQIHNFYNHLHFHPTDAIEDEWGKKNLEKFRDYKIAKSVRMYAMLEDIVSLGNGGALVYDFKLNDERISYLLSLGFDIVLCYNFIPPCIASDIDDFTTNSKRKTRYKGKIINTSAPRDYALWEEICYNYTKHIVEKFGLEAVSRFYIQCFNEPDIPSFFLSKLDESEESVSKRFAEYVKLYSHFAAAVTRVSEKLQIGGPVLAYQMSFFKAFLKFVKESGVKLDFISLHNYSGCTPKKLMDGDTLSVDRAVALTESYVDAMREAGLADKRLVIDEWGASSCGFCDIDTTPKLIFRESEVFSAFYTRLVARYIERGTPIDRMLICLSGQHEMEIEFGGFRGLLTMSGYPKPIFNAYSLASHLGTELLKHGCSNPEFLKVIPTKAEGNLAIMLVYSTDTLDESLEDCEITLSGLPEGSYRMAKIDKSTANGYGAFKRLCPDGEISPKARREIEKCAEISFNDIEISGDFKLAVTANTVILIEQAKIKGAS